MDQGLNHCFAMFVGNKDVGKMSILLDVPSVTFDSFLPGIPVVSGDTFIEVAETLKPAEGAEGFVLQFCEAERIRGPATLESWSRDHTRPKLRSSG